MKKLNQKVVGLLKRKKLKLAIAESCTGGQLSSSITSISGSSKVFSLGFVTYSNESKQDLLSVPSKYFCVDGPGAVSEEAVMAMAKGTIAVCKTNIAVAISGVAGPGGGTPEKPVGTVWIAWRWEDRAQAKRFLFAGNRSQVRFAAVEAALFGLLRFIP